MKRALLIAAHELSVTIKRPAYLFTIFGIPLLYAAAMFGIIGLTTAKTALKITPRVIAVVDSSGVLDHSILTDLEVEARSREVLSEEALQLLSDRLTRVNPSTLDLVSQTFTGFSGTLSLIIMADADSARETTRRGDLDAALIISADYLETGRVWGFSQSKSLLDDDAGSGPAERLLRRALLLSLLNEQPVDPAIENRILSCC